MVVWSEPGSVDVNVFGGKDSRMPVPRRRLGEVGTRLGSIVSPGRRMNAIL